MAEAITARSEDFSKWYIDIVRKAKLADYSPVRGSMIIRPNGYAIWENMQSELDRMFKETGHENAYFPLLIPESFLAREAAHVEGFAKECAIVTHSRLQVNEAGNGVEPAPDSRLEENLVIRPTSETIIWDSFSNWIQSWRDLPILLNQWGNVVRWEMRTRLFLRTSEFLWQEGHTAHATREEAVAETKQMLDVYATFAEEYMALPVIKGVKTPSERFAGAVDTYCIEALMQDGKALQAGTSHFLGQNFAKAFDCQFQNKNNELEYVWATSWGVSTRLVGALVMAHSDDQGLVVPPRLAPTQVVIVPIYRSEEDRQNVLTRSTEIKESLGSAGVRVKLDDREQYRPGWKFNEYELQGVPLRIAIGPRDLANNSVELARRDTRDKSVVSLDGITELIVGELETMQTRMFESAVSFRTSMTSDANDQAEFVDILESRGGFIRAHWDGTDETEALVKEQTGATIRCVPIGEPMEEGVDPFSGKPSAQKVIYAKAY
ncbi:MAG: proline--tRNA ligase [Rhodothermales bacterium]|nr:proline--tRNA ligase [Rhodothermales bacterium]